MSKRSSSIIRNILRVLGTIIFVLYFLFLIDEDVPLLEAASFADFSVYFLFLVFIFGYYFLWRNELISGVILIAWHGMQWLLVFWVWVDGAMTLILGIPIGIFGILVLIYGIWKQNLQRKINVCSSIL